MQYHPEAAPGPRDPQYCLLYTSHNNWAISYVNKNLLDPGSDPQQNAIFLTVLTAIIEAVDKHSDLLRNS